MFVTQNISHIHVLHRNMQNNIQFPLGNKTSLLKCNMKCEICKSMTDWLNVNTLVSLLIFDIKLTRDCFLWHFEICVYTEKCVISNTIIHLPTALVQRIPSYRASSFWIEHNYVQILLIVGFTFKDWCKYPSMLSGVLLFIIKVFFGSWMVPWRSTQLALW